MPDRDLSSIEVRIKSVLWVMVYDSYPVVRARLRWGPKLSEIYVRFARCLDEYSQHCEDSATYADFLWPLYEEMIVHPAYREYEQLETLLRAPGPIWVMIGVTRSVPKLSEQDQQSLREIFGGNFAA